MKKFKLYAVLFMIGCMQTLYAIAPARPSPISFVQSMKSNTAFDESLLKNNAAWGRLARLYNGYRKQGFLRPNSYTIPRRIHFIWLGGHSISKQRKELIKTWEKLHPQWKIKIWTKHNVSSFKMFNKKAFNHACSVEEKTAIWSYEILYRFGGIYADTNFECLRPFDTLHQSCEFYTGIGSPKEPLVFNNLMGSKERHPIMKRCMDIIHLQTTSQNNTSIGRFGPRLLTRCLDRFAIRTYGSVAPLPISFFYPKPASSSPEKNNVSPLKFSPEAYAIPHKLPN